MVPCRAQEKNCDAFFKLLLNIRLADAEKVSTENFSVHIYEDI